MASKYFGPGVPVDPEFLKPGNFGLTHAPGLFPQLIRFGEWIRFGSGFYSHAFGIIDEQGTNIAMEAKGATLEAITKYENAPLHIVDPGLDDAQRESAVEFWKWALDNHAHYGFVTIASEALICLTGSSFEFGVKGTMICSGLVAAGLDVSKWRPDPSHIFPEELAIEYKIREVR